MKGVLAVAATVRVAACGRANRSQVVGLSLDLPAQWTATAAGPTEDTVAWWEAFGDSATALVDEALVHNYDLRTAAASVAAARAQAKIAGAPLWPQVTAGVSANRNRRRFIGLPIPDAGGVASSTVRTHSSCDRASAAAQHSLTCSQRCSVATSTRAPRICASSCSVSSSASHRHGS